jgi:diguanylate cyclase (GGDEF)-like protein
MYSGHPWSMVVYRLLALLLLVLNSLVTFEALADPVNQWQQPYQSMMAEISADPDTVLQQLEDKPPASDWDATLFAQYYISLSRVYYALSYPKKALQYARLSLEHIQSQSQPWLFHTARLSEALALELSGKPSEGLLSANAALMWGELSQNTELVIYALYVRGNLLNTLIDYQGALRDLQKAYELAPKTGSLLNKGDIAGLLALVYEYRGEDELALPFFIEAAQFHRENHNWLELSIALYGLGRANKNLGNLQLGRNQLQESAELSKAVNDLQGFAYALKELGGLELTEGNWQNAEALLTEALTLFRQSSNQYMLLDTALTLGKVAIARADIENAQRYIDLAYLSVEPESMQIQKLHIDEQRARLLSLQGQHQAAFELLYRTIPVKRKLYSQQSTQQLHSLRTRYEIRAKERENKLLEQENTIQRVDLKESQTKYWQLMLLFASSLVISGLLILLVYRTKQNRKSLERLANIDSLTKLSNRRHTMEQLQIQIDLANRHQFELMIAIADLDYFKKINDTFGHAAGDRVLQAFGTLCKGVLRSSDLVGRIGGEEFLIALPHTDPSAAKNTLENLSQKVKELGGNLDIDGLTLSISCGVVANNAETELAELLVQADEALYKAKQKGRDRVELYKLG